MMFGRESRAWLLSSINAAVDVNRSRVSIEGVNEKELPDQLNFFFFFFFFLSQISKA